MDERSRIIVAALAGAVVGAGVSLLLAPQSGKDTRDAIASKFGEARDATKDALGNAKNATKEALGNAKDAVVEKGDELLKKANIKS